MMDEVTSMDCAGDIEAFDELGTSGAAIHPVNID
jgi:hypothetical protein